jgi:hypothetical protein
MLVRTKPRSLAIVVTPPAQSDSGAICVVFVSAAATQLGRVGNSYAQQLLHEAATFAIFSVRNSGAAASIQILASALPGASAPVDRITASSKGVLVKAIVLHFLVTLE